MPRLVGPGVLLLVALPATILSSFAEVSNGAVMALEEALYAAAYYGDSAAASEALERGARVSWRHPQGGASALLVACELGYDAVVAILLQAGADANAARDDGAAPLRVAVTNDRHEVVRLLLAAGVPPD